MPAKRPFLLYGLLVIIFIITVAYQALFLPRFAQRESKSFPFFYAEVGGNRVDFASREAARLGVRKGDQLIAVDGRPYTGTASLSQTFLAVQPGRPLLVTLVPKDPARGGRQTIALPVVAARLWSWDTSSDFEMTVLIPGISLLLGFWVAFRRPRDPLAWLLLALMLSFPFIVQSYISQSFPPGWRVAGVLYDSFFESAFPVAIFLFGWYFPEPFAPGSVYAKIWKALLWFAALPFAIFSLGGIAVNIGSLDRYESVASLHRVVHFFYVPEQIAAYTLVSSFFSAMGIKLGLKQATDAKRRLRFLYWGAMVSFTPGFLPSLYAHLQGKEASEIFPSWFLGVSILPLVLFPLSLSYVIVVQKAMGVGVALRQGLQYTFARGGIRALQWAAVGCVLFAGTSAAHAQQNRPLKIIIILVGIAAWFTIRLAGDQLRTWIDRRFFRESYDSEHLLAELSDQVRSITETRPLLETVAARISETLHIPQVAVLLANSGMYRPAFAMGYAGLPAVAFPGTSGTAQVLKQQKEPARVFLNDRESWLYREEGIGDQERGELAALHAELLLPLAVRDKLLGFISLGPKRSEEPYTRSDVRLLQSVAAQTGLALENAHLMSTIADEVAQRERLNREVEIAREVQERLFPQKLPAIDGLDYAGHCRPALGVGGDYYDFLALPGGRLGIAIGDVSGKGIAAALMMASLQASLRSEATRAPENLAAALGSINRLLFEASQSNRYATFFYGQYDPATGRFDYVNAGHNPPMIFRAGCRLDEVARLEPGGTVIGLLEDATYEQGAATLKPGDVLVAFTDGISEAMNLEDEEWGEDRLMRAVDQTRCSSARALLDHLFDASTAFAGAAPQHDDMTLVVLRVFDTSRVNAEVTKNLK